MNDKLALGEARLFNEDALVALGLFARVISPPSKEPKLRSGPRLRFDDNLRHVCPKLLIMRKPAVCSIGDWIGSELGAVKLPRSRKRGRRGAFRCRLFVRFM